MKTVLKLAPLCILSLAMLVVVSSVASYEGPNKNPKNQIEQEKLAVQQAEAMRQEIQALKAQLIQLEEKGDLTPDDEAQIEELQAQLQRLQLEYVQLMNPVEPPMTPQQVRPPSNDDCDDAIPITSADCPFTDTKNTSRATHEANEPATCCGNPLRPLQQQSVWYTFTNTTGGPLGVSLSTAGSNYDTVVQVYTGSCGNLAPILCGCNDDANPPSDLTSRVGFVASPGMTYRIKVAARGGTPSPPPEHILVFSLDCTGAVNTAACSVSPASDSNPVGTTHSITVTVTNNGLPAAGVPVNVTIVSGPNAGPGPLCFPDQVLTTNASGQATFTYTSNGLTGTDTIVFCGSVGASPFSCTATKCWDDLVCPANITTSNDPGQCSAVVNFTTPSSACGTVTCAPASGSTFPVGTTTVTCTSTGGLSCSFTVTVNDTEAPVLTCPANITQDNDPGQCSAVVTFTPATATDNCPGVGAVTCTSASGSTFPVGTTTVTCSATDAAGNTGTCSFTVTVNDTEAPTVTCPANITDTTDPGQCCAVETFTATATDNCPGVTVSCSPASGTCFAVGTTTVTCTATDASGNTATCSFTVTVTDTEPPVATCPANITQGTDPGVCNAVVSFTATVTDNCPGATISCTPPSGSTFPLGTTTVTCTATDAADNTATCSFTVTVFDDEAPVLTCPANITQANDPGQCGAVVTYTPATATDNCDTGVAVTCTPASGSFFPVGTTTVTCSATDTAGNTGTCSFTVTVNDTEAPTVTCPADITDSNDPGQCGAVETFVATATDNCPGVTVTCSPASGSFFPVGTTTVTCTATDASGNTATCTFLVTVNDTEAPTANCPANITQGTDPGVCNAVVTFTATATDNCPGATISCTPASGSTFPLGTTTVTCTATDAVGNGNTSTCSFTVTVVDDEAPVLTCPANITQANDPGACSAVVTYSPATATDNCDTSLTVTCSPASGSAFPVGTTTVTCSATDTAGNTGTCSFTVTVNDTQPPTITCPANITGAECGAPVTYAATATDNCPGVTAVCNPPSGSTFPVGTTTVTCTATDASGNMATCNFTVTAADTTPPTITCPAPITTTCTSAAGAVVTFSATATDVCDSTPTVTCTPASGSTFPIGTTTVTCTATDDSGNSASCTFTVTVNPFLLVLEDEDGSDCLIINVCGSPSGTGTYCWKTSSGASFTGPVVVMFRPDGTLNLQSGPGDDKLLQGGGDLVRRRGNARLTLPTGQTLTIVDRNIDDSTCICP
ncbi:MAG: HYR domain-containing protein [Acidobacteria bacterium]|nr:HYR domain-containing protein [Acidobacteriota bacterium]